MSLDPATTSSVLTAIGDWAGVTDPGDDNPRPYPDLSPRRPYRSGLAHQPPAFRGGLAEGRRRLPGPRGTRRDDPTHGGR